MRAASRFLILVLIAFVAALGAFMAASHHARRADAEAASRSRPIQHIVVIMQENRSFDHLFHGFPGADTVDFGMLHGASIALEPTALGYGPDLDHTHTGWWRQWDNGKMDNFAPDAKTAAIAYSYILPAETAPLWTMARQYTLGDRMFQSNTGPSFVAHQYMIAGQSGRASENPTGNVWGCDAKANSRVPLVGPNGTDRAGVYPCFDYKTMADLLDAKGVTWRYYAPGPLDDVDYVVSAYQAIRHIRFGADWHEDVSSPETTIFKDISSGNLAQVSWVIPAFANSDHPGSPAQGPDWVATVVNAIGRSKYWNSTTIFIAWDDWGGFYDHVAPPKTDDMGLGFRVPVLVVGPYVRRGYVSHVTHEASGFLRYTEEILGLPSLGTRDAAADDFRDCFDYGQPPTPFTPIPTGLTEDFFLHQKGTGPPDDD